MTRIELYEKRLDYTDEELRSFDRQGIDPQPIYRYQRTNPLTSDIERLIEIPGSDDECIVKFYSGYEITVKGGYELLWIQLSDAENYGKKA